MVWPDSEILNVLGCGVLVARPSIWINRRNIHSACGFSIVLLLSASKMLF